MSAEDRAAFTRKRATCRRCRTRRGEKAALPSEDEVGIQDADALAKHEAEQMQRSAELAGQYVGRLAQAASVTDLQRIGAELTPAVKKLLAEKDLEGIRRTYSQRMAALKPNGNGTHAQA